MATKKKGSVGDNTPPTDFNKLCQDLVDFFGTQTEAAKKLGFTQPSLNDCIHNRSRKSMPAIQAMRADIETEGRFKCESLCPDLIEMTKLASKLAVQRGCLMYS